MRISDWDSNVYRSGRTNPFGAGRRSVTRQLQTPLDDARERGHRHRQGEIDRRDGEPDLERHERVGDDVPSGGGQVGNGDHADDGRVLDEGDELRSEEHTSELQSLMRISYAVFCLINKITICRINNIL